MTASSQETIKAGGAGLGIEPVLSPDGKTVTYGLYPQKRVGDPELVATLETIPSPEPNGFYLHQGVYYAKAVAKPNQPNYVFDDGTRIVPGATYWFRCEPIRWRVLSDGDGAYLLLSDVLLDARRYNGYYPKGEGDHRPNHYARSELRAWLNGEFLESAFALGDSALLVTEVDNGAATTIARENRYACENTRDKVFPLSCRDYLNPLYGFPRWTDEDDSRLAKTTDWARARGAWYCILPDGLYSGFHWTRSPDSDPTDDAYGVGTNGGLAQSHVDSVYFGVRPAIRIEIGQHNCYRP